MDVGVFPIRDGPFGEGATRIISLIIDGPLFALVTACAEIYMKFFGHLHVPCSVT